MMTKQEVDIFGQMEIFEAMLRHDQIVNDRRKYMPNAAVLDD
jgi:hypothetical protein